jgi:hypothetical protein
MDELLAESRRRVAVVEITVFEDLNDPDDVRWPAWVVAETVDRKEVLRVEWSDTFATRREAERVVAADLLGGRSRASMLRMGEDHELSRKDAARFGVRYR